MAYRRCITFLLHNFGNRHNLSLPPQAAEPMGTIPQAKIIEVTLSVTVPDTVRRHAKAEAARRGIDMGDLVTEALIAHIGQPQDLVGRDPGDEQEGER